MEDKMKTKQRFLKAAGISLALVMAACEQGTTTKIVKETETEYINTGSKVPEQIVEENALRIALSKGQKGVYQIVSSFALKDDLVVNEGQHVVVVGGEGTPDNKTSFSAGGTGPLFAAIDSSHPFNIGAKLTLQSGASLTIANGAAVNAASGGELHVSKGAALGIGVDVGGGAGDLGTGASTLNIAGGGSLVVEGNATLAVTATAGSVVLDAANSGLQLAAKSKLAVVGELAETDVIGATGVIVTKGASTAVAIYDVDVYTNVNAAFTDAQNGTSDNASTGTGSLGEAVADAADTVSKGTVDVSEIYKLSTVPGVNPPGLRIASATKDLPSKKVTITLSGEAGAVIDNEDVAADMFGTADNAPNVLIADRADDGYSAVVITGLVDASTGGTIKQTNQAFNMWTQAEFETSVVREDAEASKASYDTLNVYRKKTYSGSDYYATGTDGYDIILWNGATRKTIDLEITQPYTEGEESPPNGTTNKFKINYTDVTFTPGTSVEAEQETALADDVATLLATEGVTKVTYTGKDTIPVSEGKTTVEVPANKTLVITNAVTQAEIISGAGTLEIAATGNFTTSHEHTVDNVINKGTITTTDAVITVAHLNGLLNKAKGKVTASEITVGATAELKVPVNTALTIGTLTVNNADTVLTITPTSANAGETDGTIAITSNVTTNAGTIKTANGTVLATLLEKVQAGTVEVSGEVVFAPSADVTVASGVTLTIPSGATLTLNSAIGGTGTKTNNGTINTATTDHAVLKNLVGFAGDGRVVLNGTALSLAEATLTAGLSLTQDLVIGKYATLNLGSHSINDYTKVTNGGTVITAMFYPIPFRSILTVGGKITLNDSVTVADGTTVKDGSTLTIAEGKTLTVNSYDLTVNGSIINNGIISLTGTGVISDYTKVTNNGVITTSTTTGATLKAILDGVTGNITASGTSIELPVSETITVKVGTTLTVSGTITSAGSITNAGIIELGSDGTIIGVTPVITNTGTIKTAKTDGSTLTALLDKVHAGTVEVSGDVVFAPSADVTVASGVTLNVAASQSLTIPIGAKLTLNSAIGGPGTKTNNGTINTATTDEAVLRNLVGFGGTGTVVLNGTGGNSIEVVLETGQLALTQKLTIGENAKLNLGINTFNDYTKVTNSGTIITAAYFNSFNNILTVGGNITLNGTGSVTVGSGAEVTDGSTLTIAEGKTLTVNSYDLTVNGSIINNGTISLTGTGNISPYNRVTNNGTINTATTDEEVLRALVALAGTGDVVWNDTSALEVTMSGRSIDTFTQKLKIGSNATLNLNNVGILSPTNVTNEGIITTTVHSASGPSTAFKSILLMGGKITLKGSDSVIVAADTKVVAGSTLTIAEGKTLTINGYGLTIEGTGSIINNGTISLTGTGVISDYTKVTNNGVITTTTTSGDVLKNILTAGGKITLNGSVTVADDTTVKAGSTLTIAAGKTLTVPNGVTLALGNTANAATLALTDNTSKLVLAAGGKVEAANAASTIVADSVTLANTTTPANNKPLVGGTQADGWLLTADETGTVAGGDIVLGALKITIAETNMGITTGQTGTTAGSLTAGTGTTITFAGASGAT
jgi:hypothetical protein